MNFGQIGEDIKRSRSLIVLFFVVCVQVKHQFLEVQKEIHPF